METRTKWLLGGLGVAVLLFLFSRTKTGQQAAQAAITTGGSIVSEVINATQHEIAAVRAKLTKYGDLTPTINAAEQQYGLPSGMLMNLLYQESHFRDDIIDGTTKSSVGALGIAQFMPATANDVGLGVDGALDPFKAIPAAAKYLAALYRQTGSWTGAVASYNWGAGNYLKHMRAGTLAAAPTETKNYVADILGTSLA